MRTLKKTLALVLVLAMMFSLCITASADFTDADEIKYTEAVEVLTAIGVLEGMPDGSFDPTGTLTRAQAAKIVVYLLGAEDLATAAVASFDDVAADHWAAAYIAYCVEEGIIAGYGDGNFGPSDPLTGYQWAKMLLVAAYGMDAEDYTGAAWQIAVAKDASDLGVFAGNLKGDKTAPATREEACLYALNAANHGVTTKIYTVTVGTGTAAKTYEFTDRNDALVFMAVNTGSVYGEGYKTTDSILEDVFEVTRVAKDADAFGRPCTTYSNEKLLGKLGLTYYVAPTLTYTAPVKSSKIYNDLGLTKPMDAKWFIDGYTDTVGNGTKLVIAKTDATWKDFYVGGYGATTEVYYNAVAKTLTVVTVQNYLGKVTKVVDAKAATATTDEVKAAIYVDLFNGDYGTAENYYFETTGFEKGDYVILTAVNDHAKGEYVIVAAEDAVAVTGKVDKYTVASLVVDGTTYPLAAKGDAIGTPSFLDTYTLLTDGANVYAYDVAEQAIPTNYLYVVNTEFKAGTAGSLIENSANVAKANVIFTDGTNSVIDLAIDNNKTAANLADDKVDFPYSTGEVGEMVLADISGVVEGAKRNVGNWFAYEVEEDGSYTLSKVNSTYATVITGATDAKIQKDKTWTDGSKYTTSATVISAIKQNAAGKYEVTSFTGLAGKDIAIEGLKVLYTYAKDSNLMTNVYIMDQTVADAPAATYAYAVEAGSTTAIGTEWTMYVNGEEVTKVINGTQPEAGKVYTLTAKTGELAGSYAISEAIADSAAKAEVTVVDATYFATASGAEYYAKEYAVYNATEDAAGAKDVIEKGDYVIYVNSAIDGKVVVAYIITEAE